MACFLLPSLTGVTGDCLNTNNGSFGISIDGSAPDYTIQWISPSLGTIPLGAGVTGYSVSSLSAGTYTFNVIDSCPSGNTTALLNVYISSGSCVSLVDSIKATIESPILIEQEAVRLVTNVTIPPADSLSPVVSGKLVLEETYGFIVSGSTELTVVLSLLESANE